MRVEQVAAYEEMDQVAGGEANPALYSSYWSEESAGPETPVAGDFADIALPEESWPESRGPEHTNWSVPTEFEGVLE